VEQLERAEFDRPPAAWPESDRITGGPEILPFVAVILFLPLIIDLVILPVTAIHDLCGS
jgi:hypothetical protein